MHRNADPVLTFSEVEREVKGRDNRLTGVLRSNINLASNLADPSLPMNGGWIKVAALTSNTMSSILPLEKPFLRAQK